jgi:hypothetical protein
MIVTVGVATGCVGTIIVVTGGTVVVDEGTTGAATVVNSLTVQALFDDPVTVLTSQ